MISLSHAPVAGRDTFEEIDQNKKKRGPKSLTVHCDRSGAPNRKSRTVRRPRVAQLQMNGKYNHDMRLKR